MIYFGLWCQTCRPHLRESTASAVVSSYLPSAAGRASLPLSRVVSCRFCCCWCCCCCCSAAAAVAFLFFYFFKGKLKRWCITDAVASNGIQTRQNYFLALNFWSCVLKPTFETRSTAGAAISVASRRSFCQKRRWQVTAKYACILRMRLCRKWHGAWLFGYTELERFFVAPARPAL